MSYGLAEGAAPTVDRAALHDCLPYMLCPCCDALVLAQGAVIRHNTDCEEFHMAFSCPRCEAEWSFMMLLYPAVADYCAAT
ncbi:MAG: hypothetical protein V1755_14090 [Chloroflexota bacterium]